MDQMLHVLESNTLLNEGQIYRIKNYIYTKYPHILEHKRVELLSNTLHRILDDTLKEFEDTYRSLLRKRIIENTLAKGQMNISQSDVIHSYFGLDHKPENTLHSLKEWLKGKGWEETVAENITQYFSEILYEHSTVISSGWNTDSLITKSASTLFHETTKNTSEDALTYAEVLVDPIEAASIRSDDISMSVKSTTILYDMVSRWTQAALLCNKFFKKVVFHNLSSRWQTALMALSLLATVIIVVQNPGYIETTASEQPTVMVESLLASKEIQPTTYMKHDSLYTTTSNSENSGVIPATAPKETERIESKKTAAGVLPEKLRYHNINTSKLKKFLVSRNSLLADEPYFETIISTAREYDINPLVLFSITGQEQSFVPKNTRHTEKIANNPYNVFGSWKKYNTNIKDSSTIAAKTILSLSKDRPEGVDPFQWINRKYAEDKEWWVGVRKFYIMLEKETLASEPE